MNELEQNQLPNENTGYLHDVRPTDFVAGTVPYKVNVPDGDWRPFLPIGENQFSNHADTMACVTFSHLNALEIQNKQWAGVEINLSDRFTAKMSGTTPQGNYFYKVADSVRNDGVVFESDYPTQGAFPSPNGFDWNTYYTEIPADIKAKAFKVDESYEWLFTEQSQANLDTLRYHLKQAPIQISVPGSHPNHAVVLVHVDDNGVMYYFDSYPGGNYIKTITELPSSAMKIVLNQPIKSGTQMPQIKSQAKGDERRIVLAAATPEEWNSLCAVFGKDATTTDETVS